MKRKGFATIMVALLLIASFCVGCSNTQNTNLQQEKTVQDVDVDMDENPNSVNNADLSKTIIQTEYKPIDYRENALIVQKSEDMELYGLLDNNGNIVLEPKYDSLQFTSMNGKDYIKAKLVADFGILNVDGTECIKMGQYEDIVSAGDIGWLAKQGDQEYILDKLGEVTKELKGTYDCCIGNRFLMRSMEMNDVVYTELHDGRGSENQEILSQPRDIYDLEENLLISVESKNIALWDWLIGGDKFGALIRKGKEIPNLELIDISGNVKKRLADNALTDIIDVATETQKIICKNGKRVFEYDLNSGTTTDTEYDSEESYNSGIIMKKNGDFYQCYKDGTLLFDERFADYSLYDGVLWLENTDSQWGIVDYDGNTVIPFGDRGDRDSYTEVLASDGNFGFYTKDEGYYEFCNHVVAKGKIK